MAGTKFLDLDTINTPLGSFTLNGNEYKIWPLTVKNVVNLSTMEEDFNAEPDVGKQLDKAMGLLTEIIPDCPEQELRSLTIQQFNALMDWVQNFGEESVVKNSPRPPRRKGQRRS